MVLKKDFRMILYLIITNMQIITYITNKYIYITYDIYIIIMLCVNYVHNVYVYMCNCIIVISMAGCLRISH